MVSICLFIHPECFANAFIAISQGNTSRRKMRTTGSGRHPRASSGLGVWETANNGFAVGFWEVVEMRKERSKSCCLRQRWSRERSLSWGGKCRSVVPLEDGDSHYSSLLALEGSRGLHGRTHSAGLALKGAPNSVKGSLLSLFLLETVKWILDILQRLKILRLLKMSQRLLCLGSWVMLLPCLVFLTATPPCGIWQHKWSDISRKRLRSDPGCHIKRRRKNCGNLPWLHFCYEENAVL